MHVLNIPRDMNFSFVNLAVKYMNNLNLHYPELFIAVTKTL